MPDAPAPTYHTYDEILSQPATWRALLGDLEPQLEELHTLRSADRAPSVLFTGCGSPFFLSRTAVALYQQLAGAAAQTHPASDLMLFPELALAARPELLIAISRSGETTEVLRAVAAFRARNSGPVIGITCYDDTALGAAASSTLVARAAHERSVAQTRSFSSMLLVTQLVIGALAARPLGAALRELPERCAALLHDVEPLARRLGHEPTIERFFFLGGGPFYGLACEAMLKMKEMSLSSAEAYHVLEFRHGPKARVNRESLVVGLLTEAGLAHEAAVLAEMRGLGARVLALTPRTLGADQADEQIVLAGGLGDAERAALYLPTLQLLAYYRALHNRLNPDQPTNLSVVVQLDGPDEAR